MLGFCLLLLPDLRTVINRIETFGLINYTLIYRILKKNNDTRDVNSLGPWKFRTHADNDIKQVCYYNRNKTDTCFNSFLATREQTSQEEDIKFSILK